MDTRQVERFRKVLLQQREALVHEVTHIEADLGEVTETRESEIEEAAQEERSARILARLDDRGKAELDQIDRALARIAAGRYGLCEGCGRRIPTKRLAALTTTPYCHACAKRLERGEPLDLEPEPPRCVPKLPSDYAHLSDRELDEAIREHLRDDERVDMEELRIVCRRGVVYLDGVLPSEGERQILLQIVTDVMGLREVVDRLQVKEILWEREDRDKPEVVPETKLWEEPVGTEDVTETSEEGADYDAPARPLPDEE